MATSVDSAHKEWVHVTYNMKVHFRVQVSLCKDIPGLK